MSLYLLCGAIADSVLMDLVEKVEPPAVDEDALVVPADASPEVWADHVLGARRRGRDRT